MDINAEDREAGDTCTCHILSEDDVPGSKLAKPPRQCKKSEVQLWLKSRALKYKLSDTWAVLVDKVESILESGVKHKIVENLAYFNVHVILFFNQKSSRVLLHFEVEFCKFLKC